ncbi:MAG: hypothetical protein IKQ27_16590, partial [Lachnospiraceae bacterium]|nr:hypothetical protein [Lachnospiraceae bacterium]
MHITTLKILSKKLSPIGHTIKTGLAMLIPLLFIGSISVMLNSFPIPAYQSFLDTFLGGFLRDIINIIQMTTVGVLAIYMTIALNISYFTRIEEGQRPASHLVSMIGCLTGFFI